MSYTFLELTSKLEKALDHVKRDIGTLRTGKPSLQLLDPVRVQAYGTMMSIHELAHCSISDSMVMVSPWDKSLLEPIEKAIASSGLNLNPVVDGDHIRIVVPPLTEERRRDMVKSLNQKIESGKVLVRTIRTESKKDIESQKGTDGVSEDDIKTNLEQLETHIKLALKSLDDIAVSKEKELMTI